jgi:hypothetical protein
VSIDEVTLATEARPLILHPRLTVVADLEPHQQTGVVERVSGALNGAHGSLVLWTDPLGQRHQVRPDDGPGPRLTTITASELRPTPTPERLLTLLSRARLADPNGIGSLAVLLDPFVNLPIMRIWELLTITERVSERVQVLLLTNDEVTVAWSNHRATTGSLELVRCWGADA